MSVDVQDCDVCGCCETPGACVWSVVCPTCNAEARNQCVASDGRIAPLHVARHEAARNRREDAGDAPALPLPPDDEHSETLLASLNLDGSLRLVIFRDYRSHWDGVTQKIAARGRAERSISPGEIGVFTPTGETVSVEETTELRNGKTRTKTVEAVVYRRTATRLV